MSRKDWSEYWMGMARATATRATCTRRRVGCVIVSDDNILVSSGYNGSPRGLPHCDEVGCLLDAAGHCRRCIHAEANALLQSAPADRKGATIYCTDRPCPTCMVMILNSGITKVEFLEDYPYPREIEAPILQMASDAGVAIVHHEIRRHAWSGQRFE